VNLLSLTCLARFLYDLPCSATTIAHTLHLLEYSRCEHLFYNLNSASTALVTADHMFWITRACSRAVFANNILLDLDLDITTIIQLTKRYLNDSLHIWPFPNACVLKCTALCFSTEQNKRLPALQRIWQRYQRGHACAPLLLVAAVLILQRHSDRRLFAFRGQRGLRRLEDW